MIILVPLVSGCNLKVKYLPQITSPYITEVEFLKQAEQGEKKIKKIYFKNNRIQVPFYFFLKIENIENSGQIDVKIYRSRSGDIINYSLKAIQTTINHLLWRINTLMGLSGRNICPEEKQDFLVDLTYTDLIHSLGRGHFKTLAVSIFFPRIFNLHHFRYEYYEKARELNFRFGEDGKYYEYIIFIDKINLLKPGKYRYGIFLNGYLLHQNYLNVYASKK